MGTEAKLRKLERIGPDRARFEREFRKLIRMPDVTNAVVVVETRNGYFKQARMNKAANSSQAIKLLELAKLDLVERLFDKWRRDDEGG